MLRLGRGKVCLWFFCLRNKLHEQTGSISFSVGKFAQSPAKQTLGQVAELKQPLVSSQHACGEENSASQGNVRCHRNETPLSLQNLDNESCTCGG